MTIKQKIWAIPFIAILIFTIGTVVSYTFSSRSYDLLQRTSNVDHPYLRDIQLLSSQLKSMQENFQTAIITDDINAISLARDKAGHFHEVALNIAALDGKKAISQIILTQFDEYFRLAESSASAMLESDTGATPAQLEHMIRALKKIETTLQQEYRTAVDMFSKTLSDGRAVTQQILWINLASIFLVAIGLGYISLRLISSIMRNVEHLKTGSLRIAQGDLTTHIPKHGKDELALVIESFNAMSEAIRIATNKRLEHEQELAKMNLELEDRVQARTAELGEALKEATDANATVAYLADHDALTGLLNRRRFQEELDRWSKYAIRYEHAAALMFIDLDKFKDINDSRGHQAGDEYLLGVANLLKKTLRSTDYLGRWGGDEFIVLLPETNEAAARAVAEKLTRTLSEIPLAVGGQSLHASASIGLAAMPDHTSDVNELATLADAAMYKAKEKGGGGWCMYAASEQEIHHLDEHTRWAGRIRRALETDQFILFYQPVLDLRTGQTAEYEALLRMEDTSGHFLTPGVFLESAERFDLMVAIDRMVIKKVAYKITSFKNENIALRLSLNLSYKTLDDANLMSYIAKVITEFNIEPAALALEISETTILQNMPRVRNFSADVAELGCRLILDDIGTGFSSFHHLSPLSISAIKINGNLINNLQDRENRHYVKTLCERCERHGIEVVAKFVEDMPLLDTLRDLGVHYAQGFVVGKPLESLGKFGLSA